MDDSQSLSKDNKKHKLQSPPIENYEKFLKKEHEKFHYEPNPSHEKIVMPNDFHDHDKCKPEIKEEERYGQEKFEKTKHILEDHFSGNCPVHQQQTEENIWQKTKRLFSSGVNKVRKFFTS
jgi:hypothetical protein